MRKILVTGGTVFVSKFVAEYYAKRGDEVRKKPYLAYIDENIK